MSSPAFEGRFGSTPRESELLDGSPSPGEGGAAPNTDPLSFFHAEARPQNAKAQSGIPTHPAAVITPAGSATGKAISGEAQRAKSSPPPNPLQKRPTSYREALTALAAFCVLGAVGAAAFYWQGTRGKAASAASAVVTTGQASFDSRPAGAQVFLDGSFRGVTPLRVALPVGEHTLEMRSGEASRTIPLTVSSGREISQYVEFAATPTTTGGRLEIASDPRGAEVRIDGALRGTTPLTLESLAPGNHTVSISSGGTTINRSVTVAAGATSTLVVSVTDASSAGGWVAIDAPIELQIFEDNVFLGTTSADRLMLTTGRHELDLVNTALEYRTSVPVLVAAGRTTTTSVEVPNGSVSINALPWANVWVDGNAVGTTPLGNLSLPIGSHEVVWRHPELGERRRTVSVTARSPLRIGMDFK